MTARRLIPVPAAALAAGAAGPVRTAAPALAAPPSSSCPAGYQLLSVPALTAEGYQVLALAGSPASGVAGEGPGTGPGRAGQPGNGDAFECGVKLSDQPTPLGLPACNVIGSQRPG